jgi:hypothetical protein
MRLIAIVVAVGACGNDIGLGQPDAAGVGGPPGSPVVTVASPRMNESFYPTQSVTAMWSAVDDDTPAVSCAVSAVSGTTSIEIAMPVQAASGAAMSSVWSINGAPPGPYRIRVACTDSNNLTGGGLSPQFFVSAPPQMVSYATQIQPMWTARCSSNACHDATMPQQDLNLTASASFAELVNKPSTQCGAMKLVDPGAPERSYLVLKLAPTGTGCFQGTRMPKADIALTPDEIQRVRDWIANGAPNN